MQLLQQQNAAGTVDLNSVAQRLISMSRMPTQNVNNEEPKALKIAVEDNERQQGADSEFGNSQPASDAEYEELPTMVKSTPTKPPPVSKVQSETTSYNDYETADVDVNDSKVDKITGVNKELLEKMGLNKEEWYVCK